MAELILIKMLTAGAVGLIIGIERGWAAKGLAEGQEVAGLRTFSLAGLAGGVCALLPGADLLLALILGAVAALLAVAHFVKTGLPRDAGLTTELALLVTPLLGALATRNPLEATAAAAVVAALLGFKRELHGVIDFLGRDELLASLQLLVVAVVILPLLPDRMMGPWASINPRTIGWLVLLLLGVSYVGYFAVRLIGPGRGLLLTALLGGFTSSTAVTLSYARLSKSNPDNAPLLSAGIALACAMMAPRVWLVISAIQPGLAARIAAPLAVLGIVPLGYAALFARVTTATNIASGVKISNPFAIGAALAMASGITALSVAIRGAEIWLGDVGTYSVAALSGILDVDAISVAMAQGVAQGMASGYDATLGGAPHGEAGMSPAVAAGGILLAVVVNTLAKAVMAGVLGTSALGIRCALVLMLAAVATGVTVLVV